MITRILLDTNILIYREDNKVVDESIQELLKTLNDPQYHILIHPLSINKIKGDKNPEKREIVLFKINSYPTITHYPLFTDDGEFKRIINPKENNSHDYVDNCLLYAILKDEASFLITEDEGIHKKASKLNEIEENFSDRIFTVSEALEHFTINLPVLHIQ